VRRLADRQRHSDHRRIVSHASGMTKPVGAARNYSSPRDTTFDLLSRMTRDVLGAGFRCLAFCQCAMMPTRTTTEQYIIQSEREWAESIASGDIGAIERILADDFIGVDSEGKLYRKAETITDTRTAPKYFLSNHLNQVQVRFYGDTAVAQGSESWVRRRGEPCRGRFVWTDTWVTRNGRWQIVAAEDLSFLKSDAIAA
jgi:ketosteroid isomerase-like protein